MPDYYHKNPRQITKKQFAQLEEWMELLGDLSGIVHELNTDEIITGNQRSRVVDINEAEIEITEKHDEPLPDGTVALGYVIWNKKKFSYRQVRWSPEICEMANIVANKAGGTWDMDILANEFDLGDLLEWGWNEFELQLDFGDEETEQEDHSNQEVPDQLDFGDEETEQEDHSNQEVPDQYMILIECQSEFEQTELLKRFNAEGLSCRALLS